MSEYGRIHKKFHEHVKVQMCTNGAIGLWAKANSWCRDNRTAGVIPLDIVLTLGSREEADELVAANLWLKSVREYVPVAIFKDYAKWNDDVEPDTEAGNLVRKHIPVQHPSTIRHQLVRKAAELLRDGIPPEIVGAALKLWTTKSLSPSLLPSLASEAMNDVRRAATLRNVLDVCFKENVVTPLRPYGFVFTPPDAPENLGTVEHRAFMANAKRSWLQTIREKVAA